MTGYLHIVSEEFHEIIPKVAIISFLRFSQSMLKQLHHATSYLTIEILYTEAVPFESKMLKKYKPLRHCETSKIPLQNPD